MDVRKEEFPVVMQAYDTYNNNEKFVAEQVVNSQLEIDQFSARFAGKLIKARKLTSVEYKNHPEYETSRTRTGSSAMVWIIILLVIAALVAWGFYSGWIQNTFGVDV